MIVAIPESIVVIVRTAPVVVNHITVRQTVYAMAEAVMAATPASVGTVIWDRPAVAGSHTVVLTPVVANAHRTGIVSATEAACLSTGLRSAGD